MQCAMTRPACALGRLLQISAAFIKDYCTPKHIRLKIVCCSHTSYGESFTRILLVAHDLLKEAYSIQTVFKEDDQTINNNNNNKNKIKYQRCLQLINLQFKGNRNKWKILSHFFFSKGDFVTSCLLSFKPRPFWKGVYSNRNELACEEED